MKSPRDREGWCLLIFREDVAIFSEVELLKMESDLKAKMLEVKNKV